MAAPAGSAEPRGLERDHVQPEHVGVCVMPYSDDVENVLPFMLDEKDPFTQGVNRIIKGIADKQNGLWVPVNTVWLSLPRDPSFELFDENTRKLILELIKAEFEFRRRVSLTLYAIEHTMSKPGTQVIPKQCGSPMCKIGTRTGPCKLATSEGAVAAVFDMFTEPLFTLEPKNKLLAIKSITGTVQKRNGEIERLIPLHSLFEGHNPVKEGSYWFLFASYLVSKWTKQTKLDKSMPEISIEGLDDIISGFMVDLEGIADPGDAFTATGGVVEHWNSQGDDGKHDRIRFDSDVIPVVKTDDNWATRRMLQASSVADENVLAMESRMRIATRKRRGLQTSEDRPTKSSRGLTDLFRGLTLEGSPSRREKRRTNAPAASAAAETADEKSPESESDDERPHRTRRRLTGPPPGPQAEAAFVQGPLGGRRSPDGSPQGRETRRRRPNPFDST